VGYTFLNREYENQLLGSTSIRDFGPGAENDVKVFTIEKYILRAQEFRSLIQLEIYLVVNLQLVQCRLKSS
jgi:hypothetical protein